MRGASCVLFVGMVMSGEELGKGSSCVYGVVLCCTCQRLGEDRIRLGSEDLIALRAYYLLEGAEVVFQRG
jgi:hypothetical protein